MSQGCFTAGVQSSHILGRFIQKKKCFESERLPETRPCLSDVCYSLTNPPPLLEACVRLHWDSGGGLWVVIFGTVYCVSGGLGTGGGGTFFIEHFWRVEAHFEQRALWGDIFSRARCGGWVVVRFGKGGGASEGALCGPRCPGSISWALIERGRRLSPGPQQSGRSGVAARPVIDSLSRARSVRAFKPTPPTAEA